MSAVSGGRVCQTIRGISVPGNGWQATLSSPYANGRFDLRSVGRMVWVRGFPRSPSAGCWLGIRRGVTPFGIGALEAGPSYLVRILDDMEPVELTSGTGSEIAADLPLS